MGQAGPLAQTAGFDLNYIAVAGALYLAMGVLAALLEARASGRGKVIDAAIVDGVSSLMTLYYALRQMNLWSSGRGREPDRWRSAVQRRL